MPDEHHVLLKEDVRNLPDTRYLLCKRRLSTVWQILIFLRG